MTAPKQVKYPAAKTYTIDVTDRFIEDAVPRKSNSCMISEAIKEQIPDVKWVATDIATIRFTLGDFRYVYLTPNVVRHAILDFDQGQRPEAFSFKIYGAGSQVIQAGEKSKRIGAKPKITQEQWQPIKEALKETIKEVPAAEIANVVGVEENTVKDLVRPSRMNIPSVTLVSRMLHHCQEAYPKTPLGDIAEDAIQEINDAATEEEKQALIKSELNRLKLVKKRPGRAIPQVEGGKPPPRHGSIHRVFGVRALKA